MKYHRGEVSAKSVARIKAFVLAQLAERAYAANELADDFNATTENQDRGIKMTSMEMAYFIKRHLQFEVESTKQFESGTRLYHLPGTTVNAKEASACLPKNRRHGDRRFNTTYCAGKEYKGPGAG